MYFSLASARNGAIYIAFLAVRIIEFIAAISAISVFPLAVGDATTILLPLSNPCSMANDCGGVNVNIPRAIIASNISFGIFPLRSDVFILYNIIQSN